MTGPLNTSRGPVTESTAPVTESTGPLPKAVTAFNGARDFYQLPLALQEGGLLARFMTELYFPTDRAWFRALAGRLPAGAVRARSSALDSRDVRLLPALLAVSALAKVRPARLNALNHQGNLIVGRALRRYALRHGTPIFSYSYYAQHAFNPPWDGLPHRFLFQVHSHVHTAVRLLTDEIERTPHARASLAHEYELSLTADERAGFVNEAAWANGWVAASSFTARTLAEQGIPRERVHVVPYGVDHTRFPARERPPAADAPFTLVFVGSIVQRKGVADLLEAVRLLNTRQIRVVLCGRGFIDHTMLAEYRDVPHEVHIGLPHPALLEKLRAADAFAFPTLLEGFALVILEAMSSGVPVIATDHSAAPDLYTHGVEGFIEPIRAPERLAERIAWAIDHRDALGEMGRLAAERARAFTWARFRAGIRAAYAAMLAEADAG